jgi:hypothetical protein
MRQVAKARDPEAVRHYRRPIHNHDRVLIHVPLRAADAKRSVQNILEWNGYLPANCVRTMVRMGWDYTT